MLNQLARIDVLIIDDSGLATLDDNAQRDLLEILDDCFNRRSNIVTGQLPLAHWHAYLGKPPLPMPYTRPARAQRLQGRTQFFRYTT
jgi:DNA replication protein DnaC